MASVGEQQTWAAIASMARSLAKIATILESTAEEFKDISKAEEQDDLPLTKAAWRSEVANGKTELGFEDWLVGKGKS